MIDLEICHRVMLYKFGLAPSSSFQLPYWEGCIGWLIIWAGPISSKVEVISALCHCLGLHGYTSRLCTLLWKLYMNRISICQPCGGCFWWNANPNQNYKRTQKKWYFFYFIFFIFVPIQLSSPRSLHKPEHCFFLYGSIDLNVHKL